VIRPVVRNALILMFLLVGWPFMVVFGMLAAACVISGTVLKTMVDVFTMRR